VAQALLSVAVEKWIYGECLVTENNEETTVQQSPEQDKPQTEQQSPDAAAKAGGLLTKRNLIFGGAGLAAVILIVCGILMFTGGSNTTETEPEPVTAQHEAAQPPAKQDAEPILRLQEQVPGQAQPTAASQDQPAAAATVQEHAEETFDQLFADESLPDDMSEFELATITDDSGVLATIMENLEFLDYNPDMEEQPASDDSPSSTKLSPADSIAEVNWIEEEKAQLKAKEKELAERERKLLALDNKIAQRMLYLERQESERISKLAKLYDNMDPRAVVALMANLDDETVVSLIPRMKPKNASAVLQLMSSARAARLSKQMISIAVSDSD
jgi:flagellar motility protein MotE (MotC chaperone)